MKRIGVGLALWAAVMLAGCATLGQSSAQQTALENVLLSLIGAYTGTVVGGTCTAPPIPPEALTPCAPVPANATPQQMQDALTNCVTNSVVLVALTKYQQSVCKPSLPTVVTVTK